MVAEAVLQQRREVMGHWDGRWRRRFEAYVEAVEARSGTDAGWQEVASWDNDVRRRIDLEMIEEEKKRSEIERGEGRRRREARMLRRAAEDEERAALARVVVVMSSEEEVAEEGTRRRRTRRRTDGEAEGEAAEEE